MRPNRTRAEYLSAKFPTSGSAIQADPRHTTPVGEFPEWYPIRVILSTDGARVASTPIKIFTSLSPQGGWSFGSDSGDRAQGHNCGILGTSHVRQHLLRRNEYYKYMILRVSLNQDCVCDWITASGRLRGGTSSGTGEVMFSRLGNVGRGTWIKFPSINANCDDDVGSPSPACIAYVELIGIVVL